MREALVSFITSGKFKAWTTNAFLVFLFTVVRWKGGKSLESTWLLMGFAWLCTYSYWVSHPKRHVHLPFGVWAVAILYIMWTIFSYIHSTTSNYGLDEMLRTGALIFLFLWVGRSIIEEQERGVDTLQTRILRIFAYVTIIACFIGCFVYVLQPVNRFVGSFFDPRFHTDYWPNAWAQFVLLTWPVIYWWSRSFQNPNLKKQDANLFLVSWNLKFVWLRQFLPIIILGFVLGCLFLSYSRGAAIALFGQLCFWLGMSLKHNRSTVDWKQIVIRGGATGLVAIVTFLCLNIVRSSFYEVQSVKEKVTFTADEGISSVSEREQFWQHSWQMTLDRPVRGWGPYSFRFIHARKQQDILATSDHAHNVFLKLSSERGLPAAILFFVLLLCVTDFEIQRRLRTTTLTKDQPTADAERKIKADQILFVTGIAGVIAHNLIDYNLQFVAINLPFWLLLGIIAVPIYTKESRTVSKRCIVTVEAALITGLMVVAILEAQYMGLSSVGRHLEAAGRPVDALEWYAASENQKYSRDLHLSRTHILVDQKRPIDALLTLQVYFQQNPEDGRAWKIKGDICRQLKQYDCALESYEHAYKYHRFNDASILRALIETLIESNQKDILDQRKHEFDQLLNEFQYAVLRNAHYIALSHNVEHLIAIAETLGKTYPGQEHIYVVLASNIHRVSKKEREKLAARPPGYLW